VTVGGSAGEVGSGRRVNVDESGTPAVLHPTIANGVGSSYATPAAASTANVEHDAAAAAAANPSTRSGEVGWASRGRSSAFRTDRGYSYARTTADVGFEASIMQTLVSASVDMYTDLPCRQSSSGAGCLLVLQRLHAADRQPDDWLRALQ